MLSSCRSFIVIAALVPPLAMVAGCSATNSSELATNQIQAYLRAEVDDNIPETRFAAIFSQDVTTDVRLENGDQMTVTTDKDVKLPLVLGDLSVYSVTIPQVDRTTATFALTRPSGTAAPNSTVAIPPTIVVTAPAPMADVPYAAGAGKLTLTWSNKVAGALVHVHADPCSGVASTGGNEVPDTGSYDLATKDLFVGTPTAAECIELRIIRRIVSQPDGAFKSGSTLEGSRLQVFKINLTP